MHVAGSIAEATQNLQNAGYLAMEVDPLLDLEAEIEKLKREKNAINPPL